MGQPGFVPQFLSISIRPDPSWPVRRRHRTFAHARRISASHREHLTTPLRVCIPLVLPYGDTTMNEKNESKAALDISDTGVDRRHLLKMTGAGIAAFGAMSVLNLPFAKAQDMSNGANNFYTSDRVTLQKVTFKTQYQMNVAGNL